jgi:hypothetical protein
MAAPLMELTDEYYWFVVEFCDQRIMKAGDICGRIVITGSKTKRTKKSLGLCTSSVARNFK